MSETAIDNTGIGRRDLLTAVVAVAASVGVAGCSSSSGPSSTSTPQYPRLRANPLYLGPSFEFTLPEYVEVVDDPLSATLAVLDSETSVKGKTVVKWLREDVAVCAVGRPAGERLLVLFQGGDGNEYFPGEFLGVNTATRNDMAALDPAPQDGHVTPIYIEDIDSESAPLEELDDVLGSVTG